MLSRELKHFHSENRTHVTTKNFRGTEITADNAVNAPMDLTLYGASEQAAEYIQAEGGSKQTVTTDPVSPSPDYPAEITPAIAAGTYKVMLSDGLYELEIPDMYGYTDVVDGVTYFDKLMIDKVSKQARLKQCLKIYEFTGKEGFVDWYGGHDSREGFYRRVIEDGKNQRVISNYFTQEVKNSSNYNPHMDNAMTLNYYILIKTANWESADDFNAWLAECYANGNPLKALYALKTPVYTEIPLTKAEDSAAPYLPLTAYEVLTPSEEYPYRIYPSSEIMLKCTDGQRVNSTKLPLMGYAMEVSDFAQSNLTVDGKYYLADILEYDAKRDKLYRYKFIDDTLLDCTIPLKDQTQAILAEPVVEELTAGDGEYDFKEVKSIQGSCTVSAESYSEDDTPHPAFLRMEARIKLLSTDAKIKNNITYEALSSYTYDELYEGIPYE